MLEFSDAQGEFIDPFEVERIAESEGETQEHSRSRLDTEGDDGDRD